MMASLFSGVSGLKNHQVKMNVIGNNIANINTIGFKGGRVNFQEALVQTFKGAGRPSAVTGGTNPIQLGLGMQVSTIDTLFQQGGLETTGQITDLAIQGSGFFVLGDSNNNKFYSRAGAFGFDANSSLVDPATGLYVLGKMADDSGEIPSLATTGQITIPFGQQDPARATHEVTLANNLNAAASRSDASLVSAGTSNVNAVSGTAVNGVGGTHTISVVGSQAEQAFNSGANLTGGPLSLAMTLGDPAGLNVTGSFSFDITIDHARTETVLGLSAISTVGDLIDSVNLIDGISAELDGGEIKISRDKAGDPAEFFFETSAAATGDILNRVFGVADTVTFRPPAAGNPGSGAATTFEAVDVFVPSEGSGDASGEFRSTLELVFNETTGLVTGLKGVGDGGIEVSASSGGLSATGVAHPPPNSGNELVIETDPTIHSSSIAVYDSQGGQHVLTIEFYKSIIDNRWEWTASTLGNETVTTGGTGFVTFNGDGSLNTFEYNGGAESIAITPGNGADIMTVALDVGTANGFDGLTGFASGSHTAAMVGQDGYGLGILEKIAIDKAGNISGIFSNGVTRILAQITLADVSNTAGLRKAGGSMYQASANSGEAVEGVAGETIAGTISSGALESSAVDIAQEFTNMITAQRGFQANSRIITTSDNMLDELVNIKR